MSEILKYNTWDTTAKALECWESIPRIERAQHMLSDSPEYRVWVQACENEANIRSMHAQLDNLPNELALWAEHTPKDVGNVK